MKDHNIPYYIMGGKLINMHVTKSMSSLNELRENGDYKTLWTTHSNGIF